MENYRGFSLLITMFEKRRNVMDGIVESIKQNKFVKTYNTLIAKSTAVEQSTVACTPINHYDPSSLAAITYNEFVDELLEQCK